LNEVKKIVTYGLAFLLAAAGTAPAWAEEGNGEDEENNPATNPLEMGTPANPNYMYTPPGTADAEETESFYFGPGEEDVWLQKKIEEQRFQDRSGAASMAVKKVMGWALVTTGLLAATYAIFFHYERHEPRDYWSGNPKYEEKTVIPLITEKTTYWPSVVAGVGLMAGGVWFSVRK
jgi:hypothetical protein